MNFCKKTLVLIFLFAKAIGLASASPCDTSPTDPNLVSGFYSYDSQSHIEKVLTWETEHPSVENRLDPTFGWPAVLAEEDLSALPYADKIRVALSYEQIDGLFSGKLTLAARGGEDELENNPRQLCENGGFFPGPMRNKRQPYIRPLRVRSHRSNDYIFSDLLSFTISRTIAMQYATQLGSGFVYVIAEAGGLIYSKTPFDASPNPHEKEITFVGPVSFDKVIAYRQVQNVGGQENAFVGDFYIRNSLDAEIEKKVLHFLSNEAPF